MGIAPVEMDGIQGASSTIGQLYRNATIGSTLTETLDDMMTDGKFGLDLSSTIMQQLDRSVIKALENVGNRATVKGHIHTYRYIDGVWTFVLEDATFKSGHETQQLDYVKIIACDAKANQ